MLIKMVLEPCSKQSCHLFSEKRLNTDMDIIEISHSGGEGCSGQRKLIIDMPYIFEMVKQNAIQIH